MSSPNTIKKKYYGYVSRSTRLIPGNNPFEDSPTKDIPVGICSRKGCSNVESIGKDGSIVRFKRCPKCLTIYCSNNCLIQDHKEGLHKDKCTKFCQVKEALEKSLCKKCWDMEWNGVSGQNITFHYPSDQCKECKTKRNDVETHLQSNIIDDIDIRRTWF